MLDSSSGRFRGMNAEYLSLLQRALGINVKIDRYESEEFALNAVKTGKADLVLTSLRTNLMPWHHYCIFANGKRLSSLSHHAKKCYATATYG